MTIAKIILTSVTQMTRTMEIIIQTITILKMVFTTMEMKTTIMITKMEVMDTLTQIMTDTTATTEMTLISSTKCSHMRMEI